MRPRRGRRRGAIWLALQALDRLPWSWAEACCAVVYVVRMLTHRRDLAKALAWGRVHARPSRSSWQLALALAASQGRFRARHWLLGLPSPEALLQRTAFVGQDNLPPDGGLLFLGFHVGATAVGAALKAGGYVGTLFEAERDSRSWSNAEWQDVRRAAFGFALDEAPSVLGGALYQSRRRLLDGERAFITADGGVGREAFTIAVPGGPAHTIRAGWMALRRAGRVPVIPVTSHVEGQVQVITFHRPLPAPGPDAAQDLVACRETITSVVGDFAARFPEQCGGLLFDV